MIDYGFYRGVFFAIFCALLLFGTALLYRLTVRRLFPLHAHAAAVSAAGASAVAPAPAGPGNAGDSGIAAVGGATPPEARHRRRLT